LLNLQGKSKKNIEAYSKAVRRVKDSFDCSPELELVQQPSSPAQAFLRPVQRRVIFSQTELFHSLSVGKDILCFKTSCFKTGFFVSAIYRNRLFWLSSDE